MRRLRLSLSQPQKTRLQLALQQLQSLHSSLSPGPTVTVADTVPINFEDNILKGHGTLEHNGEVIATVCGVVEHVNKLIYVRTLRSRYKPEIGDIIVGRVLEIAQKRWKLEINFSQDAILMLSSMNLPDGIQRRRTATDELNMRNVFEENDVICAEVRNFQIDGGVQLQARSQKYGKLEKGQLIKVAPYLVKKQKQHFYYLEQYGIDLIFGCNGFVWVGEHVTAKCSSSLMGAPEEENETEVLKYYGDTPLEIRQHICRVVNAIRVLSALGFKLTLEITLDTVALSSMLEVAIDEMLGAEFHVLVAEREAERRSFSRNKG